MRLSSLFVGFCSGTLLIMLFALFCEQELFSAETVFRRNFVEHSMGSDVRRRLRVQRLGMSGSGLSFHIPDHCQDTEATHAIPKVLHFVWCRDKERFQFRDYITVKSAVAHLLPEKIVFHHAGDLPLVDSNNYDMWFQELRAELMFLELRLSLDNGTVCTSRWSRDAFVGQLLADHGGVYVEWTTVIVRPIQYIYCLSHFRNLVGISRAGVVVSPSSSQPLYTGRNTTGEFCVDALATGTTNSADTHDTTGNPFCVRLYRSVYPKDFWNRTDVLSRIVNRLLYGSTATPVPSRSVVPVVPRVGHMLWIGGKRMNFLFYLSCLSGLYVAGLEELYVYGDREPSGEYWEWLRSHPRIHYTQWLIPDQVFGQPLTSPYLISDVFRVDIILKFGGVYYDSDVLWTRRISDHLLHYDAVASFDWAHAFYPFPDYVNLGVSMGRAGSPFWALMKQSLRDLREDKFGYNGLLQPYKLYERQPQLLFIDRHLQVMCFNQSCHPTWGVEEDQVDWRTDTYAYHWTWPVPREFRSPQDLVQGTSTWAAIGKHVLRSSGIDFRRLMPDQWK